MALPHPLAPEMAGPLAERFRLLSEPTRLRLLDILRDGERSVGALAEDLGCTQANVSKHLTLLADGGLVHRRRAGLHCYYAIADESVFSICDTVFDSLRRHLSARAVALGE